MSRFEWDDESEVIVTLAKRAVRDPDTKSGNPWHDDGTGQFTSSEDLFLARVRADMAAAEAKKEAQRREWEALPSEKKVDRLLRGWTEGEYEWSEMQHAARANIEGQSIEDYVCYDCRGSDADRYRKARLLLEAIETSPARDHPLYRGLMVSPKKFKVGDRFSESLTSWTRREDLAHEFAGGKYDTLYGPKHRGRGTVLILEGREMKGLDIHSERPVLANAQEVLTSGEYEVIAVKKKKGIVRVRRIGRAIASNVAKRAVRDPDTERGNPWHDDETGRFTSPNILDLVDAEEEAWAPETTTHHTTGEELTVQDIDDRMKRMSTIREVTTNPERIDVGFLSPSGRAFRIEDHIFAVNDGGNTHANVGWETGASEGSMLDMGYARVYFKPDTSPSRMEVDIQVPLTEAQRQTVIEWGARLRGEPNEFTLDGPHGSFRGSVRLMREFIDAMKQTGMIAYVEKALRDAERIQKALEEEGV